MFRRFLFVNTEKLVSRNICIASHHSLLHTDRNTVRASAPAGARLRFHFNVSCDSHATLVATNGLSDLKHQGIVPFPWAHFSRKHCRLIPGSDKKPVMDSTVHDLLLLISSESSEAREKEPFITDAYANTYSNCRILIVEHFPTCNDAFRTVWWPGSHNLFACWFKTRLLPPITGVRAGGRFLRQAGCGSHFCRRTPHATLEIFFSFGAQQSTPCG